METKAKTCCVFGHRTIAGKEHLKTKLSEIIEYLILVENVENFLVGSRSEFDDLCREVLAEQREKYPHIKRIYVRAEYPYIDESYKKYLLESCEETYFPEKLEKAGKAVYIERNCEMIKQSDICLVYHREGYLPAKTKNGKRDLFARRTNSGTTIAYHYALKKKKIIFNLAK